MHHQRFTSALFTLAVLAATLIFLIQFSLVRAANADLLISQYIEGSSNNKAIELYNGTGAPIDLAVGGYNLQMFFNGSATAGLTINLSGIVADGDVFVLAQASANATILAQADQTNSAGWFNGDDAVVLRKGTTILDVVGQIGFDPGTEWGSALTSTADNTLCRKATVTTGDTNGSDAFDPALEWDGFAIDTVNGLGSYTIPCNSDSAPLVTASTPANGASNVSLNSDLVVTFSEPVTLNGSWFSILCTLSGAHSAVVSGGPTSFTLNPDADFVQSENCTVTVLAAGVSDQDLNDPPDTPAADFVFSFATAAQLACDGPITPIYQIQGAGNAAAVTGAVVTEGVVVGDYEGPSPALRGFYLQDLNGDGNPETSDGIFVFNGNNDSVNPGQVVRVAGNATEFQDQTQISLTAFGICGGPASPTPVDVTLPFPPPVNGVAYLERFEGMLVRLPQTLYVTEHFQLGRFGQVVLSSGDRLRQPTHFAEPGPAASFEQEENNRNRIILDDELQNQNPDPIRFARAGAPLSASNTLRGGDTATGIVGVMSYTWAGDAASGNAYRVRPLNALGGAVAFQPTNPRPTAAPAVGGRVRVAGMNLLNFFNTFDGLPDNVDNCTNGVGGPATDCRGADTAEEFERQWPKTVAAILGGGADIIGVNEIENDGYGPTSAIQFLVDKLNAATAPGTYALIDVDAATGQVNAQGTDAIKVGLLYKPAVVTPVGQTASLNSEAFVNGGDSAPRSRPSLAQAFQENATGARFVVDVNHLKSKGSACDAPDTGDGQGNCSLVRTNAANQLVSWLATDPTGTGESDVLIIGDLNSYAMEDPITAIESAGYTNLVAAFVGPDAYSYVFDGQWGYLDHALGSASILDQVTGVGEWHINADEPSVLDYNTNFKTANLITTLFAPDQFRIADHDPVIIGLNLRNDPPVASAGGPYVATEGEVIMLNASGADPDGTAVTFAWDLNNDNVFETPGQSAAFAAVDGPATQTVHVQVTDETGLATVAATTVTINNVAPTVNALAMTPIPSTEGSAAVVSTTFADPGVNDAPFTCTVNYGDGSGELAGVIAGNSCTGPAHPYTTFGAYVVTVTVTDKDGDTGTNATLHSVIFNWAGFFQPVDNLPTVNVVKAGSAIPVQFSLGGNKGLAIFAPGYPQSTQIDCASGTADDEIEQTVTAGGSSLTYDAAANQYTYVWKSDKGWSNTCRQVTILLIDGTYHYASFKFK